MHLTDEEINSVLDATFATEQAQQLMGRIRESLTGEINDIINNEDGMNDFFNIAKEFIDIPQRIPDNLCTLLAEGLQNRSNAAGDNAPENETIVQLRRVEQYLTSYNNFLSFTQELNETNEEDRTEDLVDAYGGLQTALAERLPLVEFDIHRLRLGFVTRILDTKLTLGVSVRDRITQLQEHLTTLRDTRTASQENLLSAANAIIGGEKTLSKVVRKKTEQLQRAETRQVNPNHVLNNNTPTPNQNTLNP